MQSVEFVVHGVPVSCQSRNTELKAEYRRTVAQAAKDAMGQYVPFVAPVLLILRIFYEGGVRPDNDNVSKLIQDALQGVVFIDDKQVDDTNICRRSLDEPFVLRGVPKLLATSLTYGNPFVYVRVTTEIDRTVIM